MLEYSKDRKLKLKLISEVAQKRASADFRDCLILEAIMVHIAENYSTRSL